MVLLIFFPRRVMAQAKLVVNGGVITIANGASLIIDNPDNTAITYNGTGYIQSEGDANKLIWSIGAGNGKTFLIPFGNAAYNFPFQFNATSGTGANGQIILSTYHTPTWKNSDYLPPGVTNVNKNGSDNSAKIIDRFWQINAQGYTTKPILSNIIFSYSDIEYTAPNTIIEAGLVPQRWNSTLFTWDDYFPSSSVNTTTNKVTLSTLPGNQWYNWWTLVDASTALPGDVSSTSKGFLMPRMTSAQRIAITNAAEGLLVYDTETLNVWVYKDAGWSEIKTDGSSNSNLWTANGSDIYNINSGNVGIGLTTPLAPLHIKNNAEALRIQGTRPYFSFYDNATLLVHLHKP